MKVLLREDIKTKGEAGQIIDVKAGYARNYLIPQGFAYPATDANQRVFEKERVLKLKKVEQLKSETVKLKSELEKISLTAAVKVSEEGHLYGSVNTQTIADLLKLQGYDINHRKIEMEDSIKELGVYEAKIDLSHGIIATVKVWVVKE